VTEPPVVESAATIVPVRDVAATVAFYEDCLGFARWLVLDDGSFAIVERGGAAVHRIATDDAGALAATATKIAIYIWVRGLDALWREVAPRLTALPEGRVRAPFEQPYGVRAFHVKDPDGCLLLFAERPLAPARQGALAQVSEPVGSLTSVATQARAAPL
jgi:catechol 2,3-dioxygenase-like lactoylglutathione lyase family enzyme